MELRVETADSSDLPKGFFVGVRVGDVQKQRRYENHGAFQFPAPAFVRKAKIDLYKHVGTCSVSVGPESKTSEVSVQALEPGAPRPCLKVVSMLKQEPPKDRETKASTVKREAAEYLAKWLIQERLGDAVKSLLQKRPDDPIDFICNFLRAAAVAPPQTPMTPAPPEPIKTPTPAQPEAVQLLPFAPYYKLHFKRASQGCLPTLYSKFPSPHAAKAEEQARVQSMAREALERAMLEDEPEALENARVQNMAREALEKAMLDEDPEALEQARVQNMAREALERAMLEDEPEAMEQARVQNMAREALERAMFEDEPEALDRARVQNMAREALEKAMFEDDPEALDQARVQNMAREALERAMFEDDPEAMEQARVQNMAREALERAMLEDEPEALEHARVQNMAREALERAMFEEEPEALDRARVQLMAREALEKAMLEEEEPAPVPEHLRPEAPPQGFGVYYKEHIEAAMPESPWGSLFSKFNARARALVPLTPRRAGQATPRVAPASAAPRFRTLPSVGSWLGRKPVRR